MDIRCPRCSEQWDMDSLHEEVSSRWANEPWKVNGSHDQTIYEGYYSQVRKDFYAHGCAALNGAYGPGISCEKVEGNEVIGALYDLLGDDIDGAAAMLEDAEMFGLL